MNTLSWIYFIAASVGYIISIFGSIININDDDEDNVILFNFSNYLTIGLVFYTAISIFSSTVTLIIFWSLLGISIILSLYTIYQFMWGHNKVNVFHKIITIVILCALIATVLISFYLNISSTIIDVNVGNHHKPIIPIVEIILVLWIPLMIILFIYWKIKTNNQVKTKEVLEYGRNRNIEELIDRLYDLYREYYHSNIPRGYFLEKADMYIRHSDIDSELRHRIMKNIERFLYDNERSRLISSISEFSDVILYGLSRSYENINHSFENTYLLENITERVQTIIKKELSRINKAKDYDYSSINSINENIEQLKKILNKQSFETDNKQNTIGIENSSFQQQFIKELFHCLMTPISQVDASLSIIKTKIPQTDEILERSVKSIKAGIELTKSVLFAYRQVAFYTYNNKSEDALTIKDGIFSAELLYQSHNKKDIIFEDKNIPESIQGFSNYFILAALLPLLENAIYATNSEQQIKIEYIATEQDNIFKISNPINNPINIDDLYKDGFSSKKETGKQRKGTGLSIVRNLIANIENSKLSFDFDINNNILTTILQIHNSSKKL